MKNRISSTSAIDHHHHHTTVLTMNSIRPSFICASCARSIRSRTTPTLAIRTISNSTVLQQQEAFEEVPRDELPRWQKTPPRMRMPIRMRPMPDQPRWSVNTKQEVVDHAFDNFVGSAGEGVKGSELLDNETKWIALTHKSFEHGAQGFNDRLAFLGKRLVDMQVSLALLSRPDPQHASSLPLADVYSHPALRGLENVSEDSKHSVLQKTRLARLAATYKIPAAMRWKPRKSDNLAASGQDLVMAHTMYSMVGALALRQGGEVATRVVRERIIRPLGLR